jgi:hypothetical protein
MDDSTTTINATAVERAGPVRIARIGLVGAAAAAIIAIGILAAGSTASPTGTLAAGSGTDGVDGTITVPVGAPRDGDRIGPGFWRGRGFGGITITAISGSNLSLATSDGWKRTITVDSGTTYTEHGDTIALSDLSVGDEIRFGQTREADNSFSIDAIAVIPPHAGGEVTAISGSTITVTRPDGSTATIRVTSSTDYTVGGNEDAGFGDVEVGMRLMAVGTENSDGSLTATRVRAADPGSMPGPGGRGGHGQGGFGPGFGPGAFGGQGPWHGDADPDASAGSAG